MKFDPIAYIERYGADKIDMWADAEECERDLSVFFQRMWAVIDPAPYLHNHHVDAISDHLMAVTDGSIKKLLINVPFRTGKTALVSIAWQVWTWIQSQKGPRSGPQVKFLCLSYASSLSFATSTTARRLIASKWFQDRWGERVKITTDQDNKEQFDTVAGGSRISMGFDGGTLGRGGDIKIIDDPHKVREVESEDVRLGTLRTYDEGLSSRFTDPQTAAEVIIMQRLHANDLSGHVIDKFPDFTWLMLPMEYDPTRHCHTSLGWDDPRGLDQNGNKLLGKDVDGKIIPGSPLARAEGKLLWPKRFSREVVENLKTSLGPYGAAAQLNQSPSPRGGGIIREEWWQVWEDEAYPDFSRVLVSVDTAHTEKEQNDESGLTAWGVFHLDNGQPQIMLIDAWEGRLEFHRLITKIADVCKKRSADICLIEAKANGIDVVNEIRRVYGRRDWSTIGIDPKGDKVARLLSVQAQFSGEFRMDPATGQGTWHGGMVWAPNRDFAQMVIDRVSAFPKSAKKGIVDSVSQAIKWARDGGLILTTEEHQEDLDEDLRYKKPKRPLYDV